MWFKKLFGLSESEASSKTLPLKTITYRGGVVSFAIPADWVEEYDEDGGGTFYENRRDSGTLRLNVLTFEAENDNASLDIDDYAHAKAERTGAKVITLDEGNALVRYDRTTVEDREKITIRYWEVYNAAPPRHVRIAIFSYTLLSSQFEKERHQEDMRLLEESITNARFALSPGAIGT